MKIFFALIIVATLIAIVPTQSSALNICDGASIRTQGHPCYSVGTTENGVVPTPGQQATACTQQKDKIVEAMKSELNMPYVWGAESDGEGGYDCSGLIFSKVQQIHGRSMPRTSLQQSRWEGSREIPRAQAQKGDLVYFWTSASRQWGHTGMMIDGQKFIHASSGRGKVVVQDLDAYVRSTGYRLMVKRIRTLEC